MTDQDPSRFWKALSPTDPKFTRPIPARPGMPANQFSAIDPMWQFMRLTEYFGPIGQGWGIEEEPKPLIIDAGEMTLIYMILKCFYRDPKTNEKYIIFGFGGDSITKKKVGSTSQGDDEALKKCVTDALTNAYMRLGLTADIRMNMHRDSKYLATVREFYENTRAMQHQLEEDLPKIAQS